MCFWLTNCISEQISCPRGKGQGHTAGYSRLTSHPRTRGKRADGKFLAAYEYSLLAYGMQGWCYFSSQSLSDWFHTPLLLAEVSAKLLSEANKNDLLYADKNTYSLTKYFNNVCALYMRMDMRLIIYLIHR